MTVFSFLFPPGIRDNPEATQQMNDLIIGKVSAALKGHWANPDLVRDSGVFLFLFSAPL